MTNTWDLSEDKGEVTTSYNSYNQRWGSYLYNAWNKTQWSLQISQQMGDGPRTEGYKQCFTRQVVCWKTCFFLNMFFVCVPPYHRPCDLISFDIFWGDLTALGVSWFCGPPKISVVNVTLKLCVSLCSEYIIHTNTYVHR